MKKKKTHAKLQPRNVNPRAQQVPIPLLRRITTAHFRKVNSDFYRYVASTALKTFSMLILFQRNFRWNLYRLPRQPISTYPFFISKKRNSFAQIGCIALVSCCLTTIPGCIGLNEKVSYSNPPRVGSWLQSQRELVACETISAARAMSEFGFFHPQCQQLLNIAHYDYQVKSREIVQLREGPMWLLTVINGKKAYFVPIPWHNWL